MSENEIARHVLDVAFSIHSKLGPGLLESVYEIILAHELRKLGLAVARQKAIPIHYEGLVLEEGFRADLIVASSVIVELKSVEALSAFHAKQVLMQLRLSDLKPGLLINFGEAHLKNGIKRLINGDLDEAPSSASF